MGQRANQQLRTPERMPERSFQFSQYRFHLLLIGAATRGKALPDIHRGDGLDLKPLPHQLFLRRADSSK